MAQMLQVEPQTYSKYENSKEPISSNHDMQLRLIYVVKAEGEFGKVLHEGSRFIKKDRTNGI
jgi:transcriptional regulator with XRE-family HTH domain